MAHDIKGVKYALFSVECFFHGMCFGFKRSSFDFSFGDQKYVIFQHKNEQIHRTCRSNVIKCLNKARELYFWDGGHMGAVLGATLALMGLTHLENFVFWYLLSGLVFSIQHDIIFWKMAIEDATIRVDTSSLKRAVVDSWACSLRLKIIVVDSSMWLRGQSATYCSWLISRPLRQKINGCEMYFFAPWRRPLFVSSLIFQQNSIRGKLWRRVFEFVVVYLPKRRI